MGFVSGAATGLVERDFFARLERGAAFVGDFQHAEFLRRLAQKAQAHQFAADGRPFGPAVFLADAVSGKLLMPHLRIFSVSAPVRTSTTWFSPTPKPFFSRMR